MTNEEGGAPYQFLVLRQAECRVGRECVTREVRTRGIDESIHRLGLDLLRAKKAVYPGATVKIGALGCAIIAEHLGRKPTDEEIAALEAQMSEEVK